MADSLQIRQLSKGGDLIAVVNCMPGKVTVFRSDSPQELIAFQRVLSGVKGPDLFNLVLGPNPFNPHENVLIGFGEHLTIEVSLGQYLIDSGFPEDNLRAQVSAYGLEQDLNSPVSELTRCAVRRVQLLTATYSNKAVFVLNDPFEPIASIWKERFAELLLNDAISRQRVSVVVSLSQRPECWVGTENVVRVHVGANVQKTIGFGGGTDQVNQLVAELRKSLKVQRSDIKTPAAAQPTEAVSTSANEPPVENIPEIRPIISPQVRSYRPHIVGGIGVGLVLLLLVLDRVGIFNTRPPPSQATAKLETPAEIIATGTDLAVNTKNTPQQSTVVAAQSVPKEATPVEREMLLDAYPAEIREAVLVAFDEKESSAVAAVAQVVPAVGDGNNPFAALQGLPSNPSTDGGDTTGQFAAPANNLPWANQAQSEDSGEEEERRRQIREKFLDAIRRAAEQRQQANY